jgi:predicted pyridoxine 5'-phosphate oxidase superfamily flavin-nucleotide-binding protein
MSRIDKLREELGGAHPAAANKIRDFIEPYIKAFIENSPFAVMASSNAEGDCDASPKGGTPGFIKVLDQKTLLIPDIGGNRLFQSFQNFESNPKAGFIFMIPGVSVTARVNGTISVIDEAEMEHRNIAPELNHPDDNANLIQACCSTSMNPIFIAQGRCNSPTSGIQLPSSRMPISHSKI